MTTAQERAESPSIYVLMSRVMAEVGVIGKDSVNREQNFRFRGIDAVMGALHPALLSHGVFLVPDVLGRDRLDFVTKKGTQMEAVHLHVRYTFFGPAGDSVSCSAWGEASDAGDKATGKAMSMALKSALLQTFCVPTADTEDADASSVERAAADPADQLRDRIAAWAEEFGRTLPEVATDFATVTGEDIRVAEVAALQQYLEGLTAPVADPPPTEDTSGPEYPRPRPPEGEDEVEARRIRTAALEPNTTAKDIVDLQLAASKAHLLHHPVSGKFGGTVALGELLDDVAQAKGRRAS